MNYVAQKVYLLTTLRAISGKKKKKMAILQKTKADVHWEHWTTEDAKECGED